MISGAVAKNDANCYYRWKEYEEQYRMSIGFCRNFPGFWKNDPYEMTGRLLGSGRYADGDDLGRLGQAGQDLLQGRRRFEIFFQAANSAEIKVR